jgi:hypothetical protein
MAIFTIMVNWLLKLKLRPNLSLKKFKNPAFPLGYAGFLFFNALGELPL